MTNGWALELADADLTVGAMLARSPRQQVHGRALGLVSLASCDTSVVGRDYDEALSLSTAFLAFGATSVFGSLWPVHSVATSLLMYMTHHAINVEGLGPRAALRFAQLWMLDPERRPPEGMPDILARRSRSPVLANPVSWAPFVHQGR